MTGMAYYQYPYSPNYFAVPYQQTQPQQPVQQQMQYTPTYTANNSTSSLIWVKGRMEAEAYPVAPNGAVALWDQETPSIYLKKADASGKPTIVAYDLVERTDKTQTAEVEYASKNELAEAKEDLESIKTEIKQMRNDLYGIAGKRKSRGSVEE